MRLSFCQRIRPTLLRRSLKTSLKTAAAAFAACFLCVSAVGCSSQNSSNSDSNLKKVTFMLWWTPDADHSGIYVAKEKGWFKEAGLDVDIIAVSQAGSEHAVAEGTADFSLSTTANVVNYDATMDAGLVEVMQFNYKPSAVWCSKKSNTAISSPKDFSGKTFATFGTSEDIAVVKRMIEFDGGNPEFDSVTVGTSTFETVASGQADFGAFYRTWEGVQADIEGPEMNCFVPSDYGVPGNPDPIGLITNQKMINEEPDTVRAFTKAALKGYEYAREHPGEIAQILADGAPGADVNKELVTKAMEMIVNEGYWEDKEKFESGELKFGQNEYVETQKYIDFLKQSKAYASPSGKIVEDIPDVKDVAPNDYLQ